ncbi:MAG: restriction endonuclease, partial [Chloroflexota bacterium]
ILQKLIWCDLVWEHAHQQYGGLSDPLLPQVLRIGYSWEIDQIERQQAVENAQAEWADKSAAYYEEIIDTLRSELNYWVGHVGEVFIKKFMAHHFKDQVVKGADTFKQPRDIQLTRFTRLYATSIQPYGAPSSSQIDIYAIPANAEHLPWVVEVKNWQSPVSKPKVVHFWEAAQNLAEEKGHMQDGEMAMVCWFHARSGFTGPARDFLKEKGILYTDGEALTKMLRTFEVIEKWRERES